MSLQFRPAEKAKAKLRLALIGPSGSGKTYSALALAAGLAQGGKCAVIDTEHGSASLYADLFRFDVLELDEFSPATYVNAIRAAEAAGYAVIVVDSLTHAWSGRGGALEMVDAAAKRSSSNNSYTAWRDVTPQHNALVEAMVGCRVHLIATMRTKTEYVIEEQNGKKVPRKIGMAPIQRDGLEYEFTVTADMNRDNELIVSKTRIPALNGLIVPKPGADLAATMLGWLDTGVEPAPKASPPASPATPTLPSSPSSPAAGPASPAVSDEAADADERLSHADFGAAYGVLGYDATRVASILGATDGPDPKRALLAWYNAHGQDWRPALKLLRNTWERDQEQAAAQGQLLDPAPARTPAHAARGSH